MKELVQILQGLGCTHVKTYIQSGNAVFLHRAAAPALTKKIRAAVAAAKNFEPAVLLLSHEQLKRAAEANPFPEGEKDPSKLHLSFFAAKPKKPDLDLLEELRTESEHFALKPEAFYLHAPDGIGRSKLAAKVEQAIGVPITGRNWRTVQKLMEISQLAS